MTIPLDKELKRYARQGKTINAKGFHSGITGQPASANPHSAGQWDHEEWHNGWEEGNERYRLTNEGPAHGSLHLITDIQHGELDILSPIRKHSLKIVVNGILVRTVPAPEAGWDHQQLCQETAKVHMSAYNVADAYLGDHWIGSSEV
ncbi:hypothetical protein [Marinobacterium jannaschii]|uniref:hypothetical protein n=1 Tax=Marinobacterium jannaschii TaxID=64970 RepID=UPI000684C321|nr:hypothetical protein [Marinobacterium jannaschii]